MTDGTKITEKNNNDFDITLRSDGTFKNLGLVRSTKSTREWCAGSNSNGYRLLNVHPSSEYFKRTGKKMEYLHRIMANTFFDYDLTDHSLQIDHIDGDKSNNSLGNLRMVTPSVNQKAIKYLNPGKRNYNNGIVAQIDMDGNEVRILASARAYEQYGFNPIMISHITRKYANYWRSKSKLDGQFYTFKHVA